jgi:hypothetical protein
MNKNRKVSFTDKHEQYWQRVERLADQRKQWVKTRKYGTLGAASPVRHIDPATYKPEKGSEPR